VYGVPANVLEALLGSRGWEGGWTAWVALVTGEPGPDLAGVWSTVE